MHYSIDSSVGKHLEICDSATLIKDTLTTGNTLKASLQALQNIPIQQCNVIVSVDRMEIGDDAELSARHEIEKTNRVKIHSIITLDDIIRAVENGIVGGMEHLDAIKQYRETYGGY